MQLEPEILLSLGISVLSLLLAGVALGWNIFRDVVLKARVRVSFSVVEILPGQGGHFGRGPDKLRISVTNHGPGTVQIMSILGKVEPLGKRVLRRPQWFYLLNDHGEPLNPKLPKKLDVGDPLSLLLPHDEGSFLSTKATHIGVIDSFNRVHLASQKDLREARRVFKRDFPKAARDNPV